MKVKALNQCFYRAKTALLFAICLSILLSLSSCQTVQQRETRTLLDLVDYFDKAGLAPEKIQPTRYQTLLASNGCVMYIQGAKVEFYVYDINDKIQKNKLKKVKKQKYIQVLALKIPVAVNGGIVMLTYSNHKNRAKIVRAFKKFPADYKRE